MTREEYEWVDADVYLAIWLATEAPETDAVARAIEAVRAGGQPPPGLAERAGNAYPARFITLLASLSRPLNYTDARIFARKFGYDFEHQSDGTTCILVKKVPK